MPSVHTAMPRDLPERLDGAADILEQPTRPPARSVVVFGLLAAGLGIGAAEPTLAEYPLAVFIGALSLSLIGALTGGWALRAALSGVVVLLGVGLHSARLAGPSPGSLMALVEHVEETVPGRGIPITVRGMLLDRPDASNPARGEVARKMPYRPRARSRVELNAVRLDGAWVSTSGRVNVALQGVSGIDTGALGDGDGAPRAGDVVVLTGYLVRPGPAMNPGETDPRPWAYQEELAGWLVVPDPALAARSDEAMSWWQRVQSRWVVHRAKLAHAAQRAMAPLEERGEAGMLVGAMLIGRAGPGEEDLSRQFTRLGLAHVLAISGLHITVLAGVVTVLLRLMGGGGRAEAVAVALGVVLYLLVAPSSPPVLRAGIMTIALLLGRAAGRRYDALSILGWTAVALTVLRPADVRTLGFQLSFGLTALLLWRGRAVAARLFPPALRGVVRSAVALAWLGAWRGVTGALSASVLCWAASSPILAWRTGLVSPWAVLTSLAISLPMLAMLGAGFIAMVASALFAVIAPSALGAVWAPVVWLAEVNIWLLDVADAIPGASLRVPETSAAWAIAGTGLVLWWASSRTIGGGYRRFVAVGLAAWLAVEANIRQWAHLGLPSTVPLRIDVLSVGNGTAALVRSRDGEGVSGALIGAGPPGAGLRTVPRATRALGAWRVDTVILLRPEASHLGGLPEILEPLRVVRVICTPEVDAAAAEAGSPAEIALSAARRAGVEVIVASAGAGVPCGLVRIAIDEDLAVVLSGDSGAARAAFVELPRAARALLGSTTDMLVLGPEASREPVVEALLRGVSTRVVVRSSGAERVDRSVLPAGEFVTGVDGATITAWESNGDVLCGSFLPRARR